MRDSNMAIKFELDGFIDKNLDDVINLQTMKTRIKL